MLTNSLPVSLRGFSIGSLLRKVSDKFKDIQKIGLDAKRTKARDETILEKKTEKGGGEFEKEEIFPSLSSLLTPEAVTGSEVKQLQNYQSDLNDSTKQGEDHGG